MTKQQKKKVTMRNFGFIFFIIYLLLLSSTIFAQIIGTTSTKAESLINKSANEKLTDQQLQVSKEFVHGGLVQRKLEELCAQDKKACAGQDVSSKNTMLQAAAKAYAVLMGMSSQKLELKDKDNRPINENDKAVETEKTEGTKEKKEVDDYCKYVAMASETVATFQQQTDNQTLTAENPNNIPQKEALYKVSRVHQSRAKTAKVQAIGFGSTAACYAVMIAQVGVKPTTTTVLKASAAGLLATFFYNESKRYSSAADKVTNIANALPGKGDCNPITQKDCYCAQPETMNDTATCSPLIAKKDKKSDSLIPLTCVDNELKNDPSCSCIAKNSCMEQGIMEISLDNSGLSNAGKSIVAAVKDLTNGSLKGETGLTSGIGGGSNAIKVGNELAKTLSDTPQLPPHLQEEAKALETLGVSPVLSRNLIAAGSMPTLADNVKKFQTGHGGLFAIQTPPEKKEYAPLKDPDAKYQKNFNANTSRSNKNAIDYSYLGQFGGASKSKTSDVKILNFAQMAQEKAEIHSDKDNRLIFDIISHRYRQSGYRYLDVIKEQ